MKNKLIVCCVILIVVFIFLYINRLPEITWVKNIRFNYEPKVVDKDLWHKPSFDEQSAILKRSHKKVLEVLKQITGRNSNILDIGEYNLLTDRMRREIPYCVVTNTSADLDTGIDKYADKFDFVVMNHVIEHLFNPLLCLINIKENMKDDGILLLGTPIICEGLKLKRSSSHFNEFDIRQLNKLFNRAELRVIDFMVYEDATAPFLKRLRGIRPFIRPYIRKNILVTLRKSEVK